MLHVHRAERADGLVDALGELLAAPLDDPFAADVIAVPTRGMERWLTQRLSGRLGANPEVRTASARTSSSRRRDDWSATRSPLRRASTPTKIPGSRSAPCGRCSRWSTRASPNPGCTASPSI
jgi:hypothetical protein